jgi:O-antigen/teichoic acid export membrane protein
MRSASEVGWYGTVYTLMDGVVMLPSIVTGSLGPTLSANFAEGQREVVSRLYQRGLKYLLHVGIFLAAVFAVLADVVVVELYGAEYAPAAAALRILAVSVVFIFVRRHATEVLDNVDLRSATAWIFGAGLLMNVVLNLLLIPRYGYLGAAAATVVSEGYLMGAMLWTLHSSAYVASFLPLLVAPTVAIVPAALLMWRLAGSPFLAVTASAAFYLAALTLLGAWDEKDRLALRSAVAKVRERLAR